MKIKTKVDLQHSIAVVMDVYKNRCFIELISKDGSQRRYDIAYLSEIGGREELIASPQANGIENNNGAIRIRSLAEMQKEWDDMKARSEAADAREAKSKLTRTEKLEEMSKKITTLKAAKTAAYIQLAEAVHLATGENVAKLITDKAINEAVMRITVIEHLLNQIR